jgi:hypothetical protein
MSRFSKGQAYSDLLVEKRKAAIAEAIRGATTVKDALQKLELLAKTPEYAAFNVNSLNNKGRLINAMKADPA